MEKELPSPLLAEIEDTTGQRRTVRLVAYLGQDQWRALDARGIEIVVEGMQVVTIDRPGK